MTDAPGQQPAYSYDEGFAKGLILNLFIYFIYLVSGFDEGFV